MPCNCGGGVGRVTRVVSGNGYASIEQAPGMPRYRVTTDAGHVEEFNTYRAATNYLAQHGGKIRAI